MKVTPDDVHAIAVSGVLVWGGLSLLVVNRALRILERYQTRTFNLQRTVAHYEAEAAYAPEPFVPPVLPSVPMSEAPTEFMPGRAEPRSHRAGADETRLDIGNVP